MVLRNTLFVLFFFFATFCQGQGLSVEIFKGTGFDSRVNNGNLYDNNGGLGISYQAPILGLTGSLGAEFRTIDWGNQLAIHAGINKGFYEFQRFELGVGVRGGLLLPLFYNNSFLGYMIGSELNLTYELSKKNQFALFGGSRVDIVPGYKIYGNHWTAEFNYGIRYTRLIIKKKGAQN